MIEASSQQVRVSAYLAISALLSLANWMLLLLPSFLEQQSWSSSSIGWAMGIFFLVSLVVQIFAGYLANRVGNVPTALLGTGIAGVGGLFYILALWTPAVIFAARVLHGAGAALVTAGVLIQLLQSVPQQLKGRMLGYFGLPGFIMLGLGPLASEWFIVRWGFSGTFTTLLILFGAIAWVLTRLQRPIVPAHFKRQPFLLVLRETFPNLRSILMFSVLFGFCFSAWNSFLAPTLQGMGAGAVSSFGIGYALGAVTSRLGISPRLEAGHRRLMGVSMLVLYGVALALIPQAYSIWQVLAIGTACGLGHGAYYPSLSSLAAERFHPLHAGQAMTIYISASSLGMFVGPPIWGVLLDSLGAPIMFAVAGSLLVAATTSFVFSQRGIAGASEESKNPKDPRANPRSCTSDYSTP
ncbi:MAG: MFS transporter [Acidobacteriota bacterium]